MTHKELKLVASEVVEHLYNKLDLLIADVQREMHDRRESLSFTERHFLNGTAAGIARAQRSLHRSLREDWSEILKEHFA